MCTGKWHKLLFCVHLHRFSTNSSHSQHVKPGLTINPSHFIRVCTLLYQHQNAPESKLLAELRNCEFQLSHEFFLQVCNKFPSSWRPVYRFFQYTETQPNFEHTSVTFNKMVNVVGQSRNIDLLWQVLQDMGRRRLVNDKTFRIALKTLASARQLKKCVEFFHLMNTFEYGYRQVTLNRVVETLCKSKLVVEANFIVSKLEFNIHPNEITFSHLISGFCEVGDLLEASKMWNVMINESFVPDVGTGENLMEILFKQNKFDESLKFFHSMRMQRMDEVGITTYNLVIKWMCKRRMLSQAYMLFEEMEKRGIQADNKTLGSIIYGLLTKYRVREACKILDGIEKPDINVYNTMIKGFIAIKRASDATMVFRKMIETGCEPTMHTYVMLLQGHLGKRGRKGCDHLVNFDTIFVGGLVKTGKSLEATKYVERVMHRTLQVPRFDYNKFLHYYSNDDGIVMFGEVGKKLREVGLLDLSDIFLRYREKMTTRDRRRNQN